jgi:hypothetical protein
MCNANFLFTMINTLILIVLLCTSCTLSLTCVHTQGSASDVGDEVQSPTADVSATANVPVKPI